MCKNVKIITDNSNISKFEINATFYPFEKSVKVDINNSIYTSFDKVEVEVSEPNGTIISGTILPPLTEITLTGFAQSNLYFGEYVVKAKLYEGNNVHEVIIQKNICSPKDITKNNYIKSELDIVADCNSAQMVVKDKVSVLYEGELPKSSTHSIQVVTPMEGFDDLNATILPYVFSIDNYDTGEYIISTKTLSTYEFDCGVNVVLQYLGKEIKEVTCEDSICSLTCCLKEVNDLIDKGGSKGDRLKEILSGLLGYITETFVMAMCGKDVSKNVKRIKDKLNCDCNCLGKRIVKTPILWNGMNVIGECGTSVSFDNANKTISIKSQVVNIVPCDKMVTVTKTTNGCQDVWCIGLNALEINKAILNLINTYPEIRQDWIDALYEPPSVANDDFYTTNQDTEVSLVDIKGNDNIKCKGQKSYKITNVINGTISPLTSNSGDDFKFTPTADFFGIAIAKYEVYCDGVKVSEAIIYIKVIKKPTNTFIDKTEYNNCCIDDVLEYEVDKLSETDVECFQKNGVKSIEKLFMVIHDGTYTQSGIPNGLLPFAEYELLSNPYLYEIGNMSNAMQGKQFYAQNATNGNSFESGIITDRYNEFNLCNQVTLFGEITDACGNKVVTRKDLKLIKDVVQDIDWQIPSNYSALETHTYNSFSQFPQVGQNQHKYIDSSTGIEYYYGGKYYYATHIEFQSVDGMSKITPNTNTDNNSILYKFGNGLVQKHSQTGTDLPFVGATAGVSLYSNYKNGATKSNHKYYCSGRLSEIIINGLAPIGVYFNKGAEYIVGINLGGSVFKEVGTWDFKGMVNCKYFHLYCSMEFVSSNKMKVDNMPDLVNLDRFSIHSTEILDNGNNGLFIPISKTFYGFLYYYSSGLSDIYLINKPLLYVELDVMSINVIDMTGSKLKVFAVTNSMGTAWYGTTTKSHIDNIVFPLSGNDYGSGIYDFDILDIVLIKNIRGLNYNTFVPTKVNDKSGVMIDSNVDMVKDEVFISINNNGILNGYVNISETTFGTHGSREYYWLAGENQNVVNLPSISVTVSGGVFATYVYSNLGNYNLPNQSIVWFTIQNPNATIYEDNARGYVVVDNTGAIIANSHSFYSYGSTYPDGTYQFNFVGDGSGFASANAKSAIDSLKNKNWTIIY